MAKIIGDKLFGSSSAGKLFGTSFVYYGSGYPNSKTYQRVRAFQIGVQDVPRFFIDSNFNFGVSFLYWADCGYAYQSDYDYWSINEDVSGLEGFVEDTTWINDNPCIQATPTLTGDLSLTDFEDYIRIYWDMLSPIPVKPPHIKSYYLYKRKWDAGAWTEWKRLPRIKFNPTYNEPFFKWEQTIYDDYDVKDGTTYQYKYKLCSARIFCSVFSPEYEEGHQVPSWVYVDRGDPSSFDFVKADFTIDGAWHDLDLSSIVASGGADRLVHLRLTTKATTLSERIDFREKGNSNEKNISTMLPKLTNIELFRSDIWVMMDANRKIQYKISSSASDWTLINITVRGWWSS